jgi:hypothetical protein
LHAARRAIFVKVDPIFKKNAGFQNRLVFIRSPIVSIHGNKQLKLMTLALPKAPLASYLRGLVNPNAQTKTEAINGTSLP